MLKQDKNKTHRLVHSKHIFFVLSSVHAEGKTDSTNYGVLFKTKRNDKDDKLTKRQTNNGRTQIKLH